MKISILIVSIFLLWNNPANCAHLMVTPTKLELSPKTKSVALKIRNQRKTPVNLQVFVKVWSQDKSGKTVLRRSRGLVVYPKLLTIGPGGERPIRVGYLGKWPKSEQAFRLFVEEVPKISIDQGLGVIMPIRLSIPVFLTNPSVTGKEDFKILKVEKQANNLKVWIHNTGHRYIIVNKLKANLHDNRGKHFASLSEAGWYVLTGSKVFFTLPWERKTCLKARRAKLQVNIRNTMKTGDFSLPYNSCR